MLAALREGRAYAEVGGAVPKGTAPLLPEALASIPLLPIPHPHPHPFLALREGGVAGVEGGLAPKERCLPPPGRQKEDAAGGQDVLACAWNRHGQSQWISKRTRQRQRQMQRMGRLVTLFACAWTRHGQWLCK